MISPKTRELLASSYYELCDLLKPSPAQPLPPRLPLCPSLPIAAAPSLRMTFRARVSSSSVVLLALLSHVVEAVFIAASSDMGRRAEEGERGERGKAIFPDKHALPLSITATVSVPSAERRTGGDPGGFSFSRPLPFRRPASSAPDFLKPARPPRDCKLGSLRLPSFLLRPPCRRWQSLPRIL